VIPFLATPASLEDARAATRQLTEQNRLRAVRCDADQQSTIRTQARAFAMTPLMPRAADKALNLRRRRNQLEPADLDDL